MVQSDEIVFSEGEIAFDQGAAAFVCPYPEGSRAAWLWLSGWDEARRYTERCRKRKPIRELIH